MLIDRNGHAAYDERFHEGVNIIRGENSSGKSTILNFIYYGLGGDLSDWSETALLCSRVTLEISVNGKIATLSREVSDQSGQPMDIYGGDLDTAIKAPRAEWVRYPYRRSQSKESFSQALFRLLGMPEVGNDVSGNITIHQILRLLYADQLSPVESIFKFERFDPPTLREAVGRLLCGAYDNKLYENELKIRELSKEFDTVSGKLSSLFSVLGTAQEGMTLDWIAAQRKILADQRNHLKTEIEQAEKALYSSSAQDQLTLKAQNYAYVRVQEAQKKRGAIQEKLESFEFAIADSQAFISSLERKLRALNDAESIAEYVVEVRFDTCPACFTLIDPNGLDHACHLCKTPFDSERAKSRIVALINDTALQLRQSRSLQDHRKIEHEKALKAFERVEEEWRIASARLSEKRALPSGELQDALRELHRKSGYLDRQIEDLENKAAIIQLVDQLSKRKVSLNEQISRLKTENEARQASQQKRLSIAYTSIADEIRSLLRNDLRRQDSFENPKSIEFDFGANSISVDGQSYFSASSRVVLKSSFFVGFLAAAMKADFFRHPRFCIIDTIEDKGMEPVRSHNFQMMIAEISKKSKVQHQVIFATAMIAPDLDDDEYTVGKFSTRDDPTLAISA
jgi:hypothetical protein